MAEQVRVGRTRFGGHRHQPLGEAPLTSVVAAVQASPRGQQLELRVCGHQAFGRIQDIDGMATVPGHQGHTDAGSLVQILGTCLGGRHTELALQLSDYGADHRSLLFE